MGEAVHECNGEAERVTGTDDGVDQGGETFEAAVDETAVATGSFQERITALESQLGQAHEALDASERQRAIDLALVEADAVDVETARLLTEIAVTQMDEPDVLLAVSELKGRKPFLFRRERPVGVSAMGANRALGLHGVAGGLEDAAEAALASGDRASLLNYLRMRRTGEA